MQNMVVTSRDVHQILQQGRAVKMGQNRCFHITGADKGWCKKTSAMPGLVRSPLQHPSLSGRLLFFLMLTFKQQYSTWHQLLYQKKEVAKQKETES